MELVVQIAIATTVIAFLAGLLITAISGSARNVKIFLGLISAIFVIVIIAALIFSRGLLIYLLFQLISLLVLLCLVVIVGAVCGGGIYMLRHKKAPGLNLSKLDIAEYLPAAEFATLEGITEERGLARINSGYYRGGRYEGRWYIHKAELSQNK